MGYTGNNINDGINHKYIGLMKLVSNGQPSNGIGNTGGYHVMILLGKGCPYLACS